MAWPTVTIEIDGYEDWSAEVYELSVGEIEIFENAAETSLPLEELSKVIIPAIKSWNFTNRAGDVLEVTLEGFKQLPTSLVGKLLTGIMQGMNQTPSPLEEMSS